jgi:hypothetical protein
MREKNHETGIKLQFFRNLSDVIYKYSSTTVGEDLCSTTEIMKKLAKI